MSSVHTLQATLLDVYFIFFKPSFVGESEKRQNASPFHGTLTGYQYQFAAQVNAQVRNCIRLNESRFGGVLEVPMEGSESSFDLDQFFADSQVWQALSLPLSLQHNNFVTIDISDNGPY